VSLRVLEFGGSSHLDDECFQYLPACKKLEQLTIYACRFGGPGLKSIVAVENLKRLYFLNIVFRGDLPSDGIETMIEAGQPFLFPGGGQGQGRRRHSSQHLDGWIKRQRPGISIYHSYLW
jgi:hypothetical protein